MEAREMSEPGRGETISVILISFGHATLKGNVKLLSLGH